MFLTIAYLSFASGCFVGILAASSIWNKVSKDCEQENLELNQQNRQLRSLLEQKKDSADWWKN